MANADEDSPQAKSPLMATHDIELGSIRISQAGLQRRSHSGWRLKYMDFSLSSKRPTTNSGSSNEFQCLVDKANDWLARNGDVNVCTCESLELMNTRLERLDDAENMIQSRSAAESGVTFYARILRLWLCPRLCGSREIVSISFKDFVPEAQDSFTSLLARANQDIDKGLISGRVVTIETIRCQLRGAGGGAAADSWSTRWEENACDDVRYAFVLRVFCTNDRLAVSEILGVKDLVPNPAAEGYEPFSQLIQRANKWLRDNGDARVVNLASVLVQRDADDLHSPIGSKCFFTQSGCTSAVSTEFFRILRLGYALAATETSEQLRPQVYPFYFESFTPELRDEGRRRERMERMKENFAKVTTFLRNAELNVLCVETVPNPVEVATDSQSELTGEVVQWLLTPRLYVTGQIISRGNSRRLESPAKSMINKNRKQSRDHPGPIFLRHVTTGPQKKKMVVAFVSVLVGISIIVILSVVYSNT